MCELLENVSTFKRDGNDKIQIASSQHFCCICQMNFRNRTDYHLHMFKHRNCSVPMKKLEADNNNINNDNEQSPSSGDEHDCSTKLHSL